jgi:hypothetical protein
MKGDRGVANRQALAGYYDDIDRCKNCAFLKTVRKMRRFTAPNGKVWIAPKINELRCVTGDFVVSSTGICNHYVRRLDI